MSLNTFGQWRHWRKFLFCNTIRILKNTVLILIELLLTKASVYCSIRPIYSSFSNTIQMQLPSKQNICITFIQRWPYEFDVSSKLLKCYTNVLCLPTNQDEVKLLRCYSNSMSLLSLVNFLGHNAKTMTMVCYHMAGWCHEYAKDKRQ